MLHEFDWASTPLGPADGWPRILGAAVDILLSSAFAMWMGWGPELTVLYNDAYTRITSRTRHAWALGRPASEVWADIWPEIRSRIQTVMETGSTIRDAAILLLPERNGRVEETYRTLSWSPLRDDDGSIAGILCIVHDDTWRVIDVTHQARARRRAEERATELEETRRELQAANEALLWQAREAEIARRAAHEANEAKSQFLAAMSHELRTPLNAIGGYMQLVEMGVHGPVTDAQKEALSRAQRSQTHLLGLINNVLNFAKLEAGQVEYHPDDVRISDIVAAVMPMVEPQFLARNIRHEVRGDAALVVRADAEKLRQILLNLLSNAIKFTEPGGRVTIDVRPSAERPNELACIDVRDTGSGIPAGRLASIFDPFVQVDRQLTEINRGTGLGLAISRDLARGMGGDLTVESQLGEGSSFTLHLRRSADTDGESAID